MGDAGIRDRWNQQNPNDKIDDGENGRQVVKKGIEKAKGEPLCSQNNSSVPKITR